MPFATLAPTACLLPGISQPADIATLVREVNALLNVLTAGPRRATDPGATGRPGRAPHQHRQRLARAVFHYPPPRRRRYAGTKEICLCGDGAVGEVLDGVMGKDASYLFKNQHISKY